MCELNALPFCIVPLIKRTVTESFVGAVNCILCTRPINAVFLLFPHIISCFWHRLDQNNGTKNNITKPSYNRRALEARFIHPLGLCRVETEGWREALFLCRGFPDSGINGSQAADPRESRIISHRGDSGKSRKYKKRFCSI